MRDAAIIRRCAIATMSLACAATIFSACRGAAARSAADMAGGDPARGAALIAHYGCGSCHEIAGVPGAEGRVGPPLTGIGERIYIAGRLSNSPENLERWIRDPKAVDEKTAMPKLDVGEQDSRDIAAYLYSLKDTR